MFVINYLTVYADLFFHQRLGERLASTEIRKPANERENMKLSQIMQPEAVEVWKEYAAKTDKVQY